MARIRQAWFYRSLFRKIAVDDVLFNGLSPDCPGNEVEFDVIWPVNEFNNSMRRIVSRSVPKSMDPSVTTRPLSITLGIGIEECGNGSAVILGCRV